MIYIKDGNLLDAKEDMICHQVNCRGVMGSGVALAIKSQYPEAYVKYRKHCNISGSELLGKIQALKMNNNKIIVNMFGQDMYGLDKQYTDLDAFTNCVYKVYKYARDNNLTVAMPYKIGCGRGGADWNKVYGILQKYFNEHRHRVNLTLYKY